MSKNKYICTTSIAVLCAYCGIAGSAVMSKYGEIQSVKNYSSNPFWTPDSPYNMRMPTPIYATGPDLNTETCNNTVAALVGSYCSSNNNCTNKQLSDVRPTIMVQLSQLPGANYATSCGGYIDSAFKNYKKNHGNLSTGINIVQTNKPKTTLTLTPATNSTKVTKTDGVAERTAELERLQSITTPSSQLTAADFPKTIADISFVDRVANATAGYEPYKDLKAYKIPKFETEQEYYARMESVLKHNINYETYKGRPTKQSPTSYLTGRGAKIAWTPSRDNSIFRGWCADESLTLKPDECDTNCQMTPSIDPMDRADKMFYACWECEDGHELKNHQCGCPDPDYMDPKKNCDCTKQLPGLLKKSSDGMKCECKNGMDITSGCKCVGPYTTQNPTTHQCECLPPYEQKDPNDINQGCQCRDPLARGQEDNNCNVVCPDGNALMNPLDNCKCPTRTRQSGNECVCENGTGNPPDCTCPDPNADHKDPTSCACYPSNFMDNSDCGCLGKSTWNDTDKKCECPIDSSNLLTLGVVLRGEATLSSLRDYIKTHCDCPPEAPNFNTSTNQCEEDASGNTGDRYEVWACLGYPSNIQTVLNERKNNGNSMLDKWGKYCYTIPRDMTNCIDFSYLTSTTSPVNRIFYSIKPDTNFGIQVLTGSLTAPGGELTKGEVDSFIGELISNISDVTRECTSSRREWFLFFDKLPSTGTSLTPYKALCIGGTSCTPGTITTY